MASEPWLCPLGAQLCRLRVLSGLLGWRPARLGW